MRDITYRRFLIENFTIALNLACLLPQTLILHNGSLFLINQDKVNSHRNGRVPLYKETVSLLSNFLTMVQQDSDDSLSLSLSS